MNRSRDTMEAPATTRSVLSGTDARIVVTGMAGAGKSTLARRMASKTGLPLICLDYHSWDPGWVRVTPEVLYQKQLDLLAGARWIVDSNDVDDDLLVQRATMLVIVATPWWRCSWRAFLRGLRRPPGTELPPGCEESFLQRMGDEWAIVFRNYRRRHVVRAHERMLAERCREHFSVHILSSRQEIDAFVDAL